jgi:intracellular multiplication protein IcmO
MAGHDLITINKKINSRKAEILEEVYTLKKVKELSILLAFLPEYIDYKIKQLNIEMADVEVEEYPKVGIDAWKDLENTNTFRFGTDLMGQPVFTNQMTQHCLVMGSTGSGKSVFLLQLLKQVIFKGGGSTFIDGKADLKLMRQVMAIAYEFGREDDIVILNFNTEKTDDGKQVKSNTFNLFSNGEPDEIFETLKSIALPNKDEFFITQAASVLKASLVGLFFDRDVKNKPVTMKDLGERLELGAFRIQMIPPADPTIDLVEQTPDLEILAANPSLLPFAHLWCPPTYNFSGKLAKDFYAEYLRTYKGDEIAMNEIDDEPEIPEQMNTQHGYSQTYFSFLKELSTKFGNIFNDKYSDIDFRSIIADNKIMYVLLPEMKLSPATAQKLGLLVIDSMKKGISKSLGSDAESDIKSGFLDTLRATSNPTHLFILDEFGSYITEAIEAILAQARSVGIGVIIAAQDIASLNKSEAKEILKERIIANCVTKVFLKLTDNVSANQAIELIGKIKVMENTGYEIDDDQELVAGKSFQEVEKNFTDITELGTFKNGFGIVIIDGRPRKFIASYYEPEPVNLEFNKWAT